jgi:hypothetical protein
MNEWMVERIDGRMGLRNKRGHKKRKGGERKTRQNHGGEGGKLIC